MESIKKLRENLKDCTFKAGVEPHQFDSYWITKDACDMLIDEIEREVAERYMLLPVDADGVPIKMGDEVVIPQCYEGNVVSIEVGAMETLIGVDGHDGYLRYGNSDICHFKQRTIEDVLRELLRDTAHYFPSDCEDDKCEIVYAPVRTCTVEGVEYDDLVEEYYFDLSCGHVYWGSLSEPPKFCVECGAKVVEE